jgi:hypothetical protein
MQNTPFNNPFKCSLKKKDATHITINKKIELELDSSVIIKKTSGEGLTLADLQDGDRLEIIVSPIEPHKVIEIEVFPAKELTPEELAQREAKQAQKQANKTAKKDKSTP